MQLKTFKFVNMKLHLLVVLLLVGLTSCGQIKWDASSDWTIYQTEGDPFKVSIDSLRSLDCLHLSMDTVKTYLEAVEHFNPKSWVSWMGGYIASCKIDGIVRKIELSNYGGFFYDEKTHTFYKVSEDQIESWNDFIQNSYLMLVKRQHK